MKVGILTLSFLHNYGTLLQAYALRRVIEKRGHQATVINFYPEGCLINNKPFVWNKGLRKFAKSLVHLLHFRSLTSRYARFEEFKNTYLNLTPRFSSPSDVKPEGLNAVVCGSDQVWNAAKGIDSFWLLDFVKKSRKVAYGPSFGGCHIHDSAIPVFKKYLPEFDSLSCRERDGVEIIKNMTGIEAELVLDPTLLIEPAEWNKLCSPRLIKDDYILVYSIEESPAFFDLISSVKKKLNLPVILLSRGASINRYPHIDKIIRDAGPSEFLSLFRYASFICTNSFHGIAYSINFQKPFLATHHTTENSRLSSLLQLLNLTTRQLKTGLEPLTWSREEFDIDYSDAISRLKQEVETSIAYLTKALPAK
jgi:hypothetical protein